MRRPQADSYAPLSVGARLRAIGATILGNRLRVRLTVARTSRPSAEIDLSVIHQEPERRKQRGFRRKGVISFGARSRARTGMTEVEGF